MKADARPISQSTRAGQKTLWKGAGNQACQYVMWDENSAAYLHFQLLLLIFKQILVYLILLSADLVCKHVVTIEIVSSYIGVAQYPSGTEELL